MYSVCWFWVPEADNAMFVGFNTYWQNTFDTCTVSDLNMDYWKALGRVTQRQRGGELQFRCIRSTYVPRSCTDLLWFLLSMSWDIGRSSCIHVDNTCMLCS